MDLDQEHGVAVLTRPPEKLDYSLTGETTARAIERGLAEADWYQSPVPARPCASCSNAATAPPSATRSSGSR